MTTEHAAGFRRLLETRVRVLPHIKDHDRLLAEGQQVAYLLSQIIANFLTSFDISSAPAEIRGRLQASSEALVFYGLLTHCLLFGSHYRLRSNEHLNLDELYSNWLVKSPWRIAAKSGCSHNHRRRCNHR